MRSLVRAVSNKAPGHDALEDAVARADARQHTPEFKKSWIAKTSYANCGRASMLTPAQKKAIVDFVKRLQDLWDLQPERGSGAPVCDQLVTARDSPATTLWPFFWMEIQWAPHGILGFVTREEPDFEICDPFVTVCDLFVISL